MGLSRRVAGASSGHLTILACAALLAALGPASTTEAAPTYQLHGFVKDSADAPLRGAVVDARSGKQFAAAKTGTDGSYTIPVAAGTYEVEVGAEVPSYLHESLRSSAYIEEVSVNEDTVEDFSLPAEGTIDAQVLDASEHPAVGARVCLSQNISERQSTTPQGTPVAYFGAASDCGETDDNGDLPLYGFIDAPATVTTYKAKELSFPTEAVPTTAGTPLTISFPDYPSKLHGVVHDSTDAPLRGASVAARAGMRFATATTGTDGSYSLSVAAGAYEVEVTAATPSYLHEDLESEAQIEGLTIEENTAEDFSLAAEGKIETQVLDANEQPVVGIQTCLGQSVSQHHATTPQGTPVTYSWSASDCGSTDGNGDLPLYGFVDSTATVSSRRSTKEPFVTAMATPGATTSLTLFLDPPTITKLATKKGPAAGGTSVSITGTNLGNASAVSFGGESATTFEVTSPTSITAIAPPNSAGQVDVRVMTHGNASAITNRDLYRYENPTVTGIAPSAGPPAGGASVTVTGSGFVPGTGLTKLSFKNSQATSVSCASTTECTATTPPGKGSVDVVATVGKYKSKKSAADRYTYG
jgi:IPT/TIG domain/Carboxypeptidase regulatory-like domain